MPTDTLGTELAVGQLVACIGYNGGVDFGVIHEFKERKEASSKYIRIAFTHSYLKPGEEPDIVIDGKGYNVKSTPYSDRAYFIVLDVRTMEADTPRKRRLLQLHHKINNER